MGCLEELGEKWKYELPISKCLCWYDNQYTGKKREVKVALRETRKGYKPSSSRYYNCRKEHENLLEEMRQALKKRIWNR
jgi:hypothetical protein